jgi:hypothetical protein
MIKNHESEAGRVLAAFLMQILLSSDRYNYFSGFYATALKFRFITNISMLFQTMSMMSFIAAG